MPDTLTAPPIISIDDRKITQREAARLLGVSFPTASRYMTAGRHGVRLPSAKIGGKRLTSREAVAWFFRAVQVAEELHHRDPHLDDDLDDDLAAEARELDAIAEREGL